MSAQQQGGEAARTASDDGASTVAKYVDLITHYETEFDRWHSVARDVIRRYTDERGPHNEKKRRFNILWSNIQTLAPALYFNAPKPNIERRFRDKDAVGRLAADILERACSYYVNDCDFVHATRLAVQDRLLPGRGTVWLRYVPHFRDAEVLGTPEVEELGESVTSDAEEAGRRAKRR